MLGCHPHWRRVEEGPQVLHTECKGVIAGSQLVLGAVLTARMCDTQAGRSSQSYTRRLGRKSRGLF